MTEWKCSIKICQNDFSSPKLNHWWKYWKMLHIYFSKKFSRCKYTVNKRHYKIFYSLDYVSVLISRFIYKIHILKKSKHFSIVGICVINILKLMGPFNISFIFLSIIISLNKKKIYFFQQHFIFSSLYITIREKMY